MPSGRIPGRPRSLDAPCARCGAAPGATCRKKSGQARTPHIVPLSGEELQRAQAARALDTVDQWCGPVYRLTLHRRPAHRPLY